MVILFLLKILSLVSIALAGAPSYENWLGNLSPYHQAPQANGINENLPADCTVQQVMLECIIPFLFTCCD